MMDKIYVVGTDTGVGKTVLSLLLMRFFLARGLNPFYLKPLQTGCAAPDDPESDAAFIYRHVPSLRGKDPAASVLYCFPNPKAPFFAARDAGKEIDLTGLKTFVTEKSRLASPLVVEAAGGLLAPVSRTALMLDTIGNDSARVVLAARAGLGTINHTLLSIEALRAHNLQPAGIVFLDSADTEAEMIAENMEAIKIYSGIKVAGVIGKISDFDHPPEDYYRPLEFLLSK